jgi:holliday junction DNA helicase RuvA
MIASLRGIIQEKGEGYIILDVQGVGYKVFVTNQTANEAILEKELFCYIHHYVREDIQDLYGFIDEEAKGLFSLLITISGVGPRSAQSVLDVASIEDLKAAIAADDPQLLKQVAGIGPKLAERITLELKNKLTGSIGVSKRLAKDVDVIEGLISLGYSRSQAQTVVQELPKEVIDTGERMKLALQRFRK